MCRYEDVRAALLEKREIAFLDVREEDPHAQAHPLFAANFPLSRVELDAYSKLPRRDVQIVTLDEGDVDVVESDAMLAARRLVVLGFSRVAVFAGGVRAWQAAGGELFRDVNVPSKSFGELVEAKRHTPSLSAPEVNALIEQHADVVIVDARRYDEYNTMSIPTATSCPGAELVLRIAELAPRPETQVIVNCAGRTRSIIGTQSLINAGIPNKVSALRNGTIGWTLAGQVLDKGETRKFKDVSEHTRLTAAARARSVAERAGVKAVTWSEAQTWQAQAERTTYFFDTRTPEEYAAGHIAGFRSTPGGQLVQETEMVAPVRGARIVLVDTDGVRANMTASWLAQMAWDVYVLAALPAQIFAETGPWVAEWAKPSVVSTIAVAELAVALVHDLAAKKIVVVDLSSHVQYVQGHIPGAQYVLRSQFKQALSRLPKASAYVLVCPDGLLSTYAHAEIAALLKVPVSVLTGGTQAWKAAGQSIKKGAIALLSDPIDRYKRPYEGTDAPHEAMQAYLDWEFGLVAQLGIDGTHHFAVL
ncbi:MAG: sulfurtransferase [Alcaligenaceae bacterium]|nr:MAG: sulfurtransferase [Alcaligenaceae bacterium]